MVKDPLPIGTHGVINLTRIRPKVWRARASYRDYRGVRRDVTAQAPTKPRPPERYCHTSR